MGDFNENEQIVLRQFSSASRITRQQVEEILGVSQTMAGRVLKRLVEKNVLTKRGAGQIHFIVRYKFMRINPSFSIYTYDTY